MSMDQQAGFRKGYSTMDHIHMMNIQLIEQSQEYNIPLYIAWIDYQKAFDSLVQHGDLSQALWGQGICGKPFSYLPGSNNSKN